MDCQEAAFALHIVVTSWYALGRVLHNYIHDVPKQWQDSHLLLCISQDVSDTLATLSQHCPWHFRMSSAPKKCIRSDVCPFVKGDKRLPPCVSVCSQKQHTVLLPDRNVHTYIYENRNTYNLPGERHRAMMYSMTGLQVGKWLAAYNDTNFPPWCQQHLRNWNCGKQ